VTPGRRSHIYFFLFVAIVAIAGTLLAQRLEWTQRLGVYIGLGVACGLAVFGYTSLALTWRLPQSVFLTVMIAGVVCRLLALGAVTVIVVLHGGIDPNYALLTLVGAYFPMSLVEVALFAKDPRLAGRVAQTTGEGAVG
jgi:hypothetical protein